jgi:hypothetical protein
LNPGSDRLLRAAERLLKSNVTLARQFFLDMGYLNDPWVRDQVLEAVTKDKPPALEVEYVDHGGGRQEWGGPPGEWPDHVREYSIGPDDVEGWDLTEGGELVLHGYSANLEGRGAEGALSLYTASMDALGVPVNPYELRPGPDDYDAPNYHQFYDEDGEPLPRPGEDA